ncbi:hypothetical protein TIFTF001_047955 [Ficus carica]|uniref:Transmembrane protein n=1 Tax=Ficus carica TaxID=3494 RepID=A0AA87ZBZ1_FICCA|nr:hypothetical protein TIFTF001_047955 [Ficus carica]
MAEKTVVSDDLSEWEQIQVPFPQTRPSVPQQPDDAVVVRDNDDDNCGGDVEPPLSPVVPPHPHEPNSPSPSSSSSSPTPPPSPPAAAAVPSSSSSTNAKRDEEATRRRSDSRLVAAREIGKRFRLRLGILSAEVLRAASKVCNYRMIVGRFWSIASVTGVVTTVLLSLCLLYLKLKPRWRTRITLRDDRERLILLLNDKDEKISQLLVQIAEMNEALSVRRRVPVLRVG